MLPLRPNHAIPYLSSCDILEAVVSSKIHSHMVYHTKSFKLRSWLLNWRWHKAHDTWVWPVASVGAHAACCKWLNLGAASLQCDDRILTAVTGWLQRGKQFAETSTRARQTIAELGAGFVHQDAVVMLHGYSRVALALLQQVANNVSTEHLPMAAVLIPLLWMLLLITTCIAQGRRTATALSMSSLQGLLLVLLPPRSRSLALSTGITCVYVQGEA